ncbi:MAG: Spo0E family sporulation regulatory protein-aspartic acid phosphatase [Clostridia bacterium]|nr:Spo0E family sporulation regulatory protein-aspartic acid phosphatase [Clostridia bacterium]
MLRLEMLRKKLYKAIESGNSKQIMRISEILDKEILKHVCKSYKPASHR